MRPQTQIEIEIDKILSKYPKLSKLGYEVTAMKDISLVIFNKVLTLEQVGLRGVDEWAIDVERIKQLQEELFSN